MRTEFKLRAHAFLTASARIFSSPLKRKKRRYKASWSHPRESLSRQSALMNKNNYAMAKFRFVTKKNLQKKDDPGKWYASPVVTNRLNTGTVCRVVTRNTTTAPTELESGFNLVCDGIPLQLQLGNSVQLGKLGSLRLSFGSVGVDDIDQFNAATMIKNVKVIFTPSKELMAAIKDGLSFENAGVVENGFTYATTRAYKEAKGQGGGSTPGGNETPGGDQNENPLG